MRSFAERIRRTSYSNPLLDRFRVTAAALRSGKPIRMLLVSDKIEFTSEQQFAPILRNAPALYRAFNLIPHVVTLEKARSLSGQKFAGFDIIGLKLSFRMPRPTAISIAKELRCHISNKKIRYVYFDGDDDCNIQWPDFLDIFDFYVKKHVFRDVFNYGKRYVGKNNLTNYVAHNFGEIFDDDIIPTSGGICVSKLSSLHLGWNISLDDKIFELSQVCSDAAAHPKDIDVTCRAYVPPSIWTHGLRVGAIEKLESLASDFQVRSPRERVSQAEYNAEMARSRICVSPFGFGEICWRDFEAISMGCLLVKPDMSHIHTAPDLYRPHETYVPVSWDFSNLESVCRHYLEHEEQRLAIATRAREQLLAALQPDWFVKQFGELLDKIKLN